jgi:hypothetical protein
MGEARTRA